MWLCWIVKSASPVWVSQIFLQSINNGDQNRVGVWACVWPSTYAVKSADAVAALLAFGLSRACHTAPLWPINVPILATVSVYYEANAARGQSQVRTSRLSDRRATWDFHLRSVSPQRSR